MEQALALEHLGGIDVTPGRHAQVAAVEQYAGQDIVADLRFATMGRGQAIGLRRGAVVMGDQRTGQAHVVGEGIGILLIEIGLASLPAETAEHATLQLSIPDDVGAPGNAVTIGVIRIGIGQNGVLGNGLEQAESDHRRGDTRGEQGVRMHGAIAQLADLQLRFAQLHQGAIGEAHRHAAVGDADLALGRYAGVGHVLQLSAVGGLGHHALAL